MANVLVAGYDGTDGGKAALASAIELAKDLGAEVVLVFAYEPSKFADEAGDYERAVKEHGRDVTAEGMKQVEAGGVKGSVELVPTRPVEALVRVAKERDARMIVVGSYGEGPLKGAIVGSTPHKLLQLSEHPVLVVRT